MSLPGVTQQALFIDRDSDLQQLRSWFRQGNAPSPLPNLPATWFSQWEIDALVEEEARHGSCILTPPHQSFRSRSTGQRRKAFLDHLLEQKPPLLLLYNPFDSLDAAHRELLLHTLQERSGEQSMLFLLYRQADLPEWVHDTYYYRGKKIEPHKNSLVQQAGPTEAAIPKILDSDIQTGTELVRFQGVSLKYGTQPVLHAIHWTLRAGEFWELRGPNGSGKTSLISMITGDNPKAYGQPLILFGSRKGSGESVWELKARIGYTSPALTDRFTGYHSCLNMLISGLRDSIGLYEIPTDREISRATQWLEVLGMDTLRDTYFHELDPARQRLLLCARAMIKAPALLLLDEPTAGLDARGAAQVVALVRQIARDTRTCVVFVSHRTEPGLAADKIFELRPGPEGATGHLHQT